MRRFIPINKPLLGNEELEEVAKVMQSGMLSNPTLEGGTVVQRFEKAISGYTGAKNAITVNSGTAALHASLLALDIKQGDEVIVPPVTFGATSNAVLLVGATPIFVDVDIETFNLDPALVKSKITRRTKAIIPVHLYGMPANMDAIMKIAKENGLAVIEDACQALGAEYEGHKVGTIGTLGCFSFYPAKVITTGEGGAIITDDDSLDRKLRMVRTAGQVEGYDYAILGSNFRMPEIAAAIGCVQMKKLPLFLDARRRNAITLSKNLDGISALACPKETEKVKHNYYLYTVRLLKHIDKRDEIVAELRRRSVDARAYYATPVHKTPMYRNLGYSQEKYPVAELIAKSTFSLPVNPELGQEDIEYISACLWEILGDILK